MFSQIGYPYQIRSDAITAVGAPSTIAFLIRALYWLYLVVRAFFKKQMPGAIAEVSEEEAKDDEALSETVSEVDGPGESDLDSRDDKLYCRLLEIID